MKKHLGQITAKQNIGGLCFTFLYLPHFSTQASLLLVAMQYCKN